ncbi:hypothetical protein [Rubinisphaera sp.]|uniref:hypothetical protein n=1 Tax=Rubinisphaera sp. TaxID=2024857 RepID=UPI000C0C6C48|nr:hypothetical protein [Rubinisphaera sp.]MBV07809.1 hypothetical protein [Rubinisphaera sp.]HCS53175.1 hypothetical protein [Planctomycetaceae bacterium]|tara:strand:- start:3033 stop:6470 length:3438 start_codon:yes stop_codon:yes gene_type:complete
MAIRRYAGDAPDVAQQMLIPTPPVGFDGSVTLGINRKFLEFESWDPAAIAAAWNSSTIPDFQRCVAAVTDEGVLMTASTAGVMFNLIVLFAGSANYDAVLMFSKINYSESVTGDIDITFLGQLETLDHDFEAFDLQSAFEAMEGVDPELITVVDISETQIRVTLAGDYVTIGTDDFTIDDSDLRGGTASVTVAQVRPYSAGVNEVQRLSIRNATGGTFALRMQDNTVIGLTLANDVDAAALEAAFDAAIGSGAASVADVSSGVFDVTFDGGAFAETNVGLMKVDYSNLTPTQSNDTWQLDTRYIDSENPGTIIQTDGNQGIIMLTHSAGTISSVELVGTPQTDFASFDSAINAVLSEYFGAENYIITADVESTDGLYEIEAVGDYAGQSGVSSAWKVEWYPQVDDPEPGEQPTATISTIQEAEEGTPEKQTFSVPIATSGVIRFRFALTSGNQDTTSLSYDFAAAELETALESIFGSGKVVVEGSRATGLVATYDQTLGNVPLPTIIQNTLVFTNTLGVIDAGLNPTTATVTVVGTPSGGTWVYSCIEGSVDTPLNWNDSAAQIQAKIDAQLTAESITYDSVSVVGTLHEDGVVAITVSGFTGEPFGSSVTNNLFYSTSANIATTQLFVAGTNEVQRIEIDHEPAQTGYVTITHNGNSRQWPASDLYALESYLNSIAGLSGNVDVRNAVRLSSDNWWSAFDIEFINGLSGTDVEELTLQSFLDPVSSINPIRLQDYVSTKTQTGADAANVAITTETQGSPELGAQQQITIAGNPHFGTFTSTINGQTTAAIEFDATNEDNEDAIELLSNIDPGEVTASGTLADGLLLDFATSVGAVTMSVADVDLTNASLGLTAVAAGRNTIIQTITRSQGKNHFEDPRNWIPEGPINSGDDLVFESGNVSCLYGILQRSDFTVDIATNQLLLVDRPSFLVGQLLTISSSDTLPAGLVAADNYLITDYDIDTGRLSLSRNGVAVAITDAGTGTHRIRLAVQSKKTHARFTGYIGLPRWNPNGFVEYLPTELAIGWADNATLIIAQGRGSASGRIGIDFGPDAVKTEVFQTGGSQDDLPALVLLGTNDACELLSYDGEVGLGMYEGTEFRYAKMVLYGGEVRSTKLVSSENAILDNFGAATEFQRHQFDGTERSQG